MHLDEFIGILMELEEEHGGSVWVEFKDGTLVSKIAAEEKDSGDIVIVVE